MSYLAIKHFHILCAILSGALFLLQGGCMIAGKTLLRRRWARRAPHVIDTFFLSSALTMVYLSGQYPFVLPWLTAKVLALLLYIVLGAIALKRGKTYATRVLAFGAAVTVFGYIVAVALSKQPLPFGA